MDFKNYLKLYLTDIIFEHYFDFEGRETRKVFWLYTLNMFIIYILFGMLSLNIVGAIISILVFLPSLGMFVRRLHDINFSGWWVLISLIPFLGFIALYILECLPGTEGENKYGHAKNVVGEVQIEQ